MAYGGGNCSGPVDVAATLAATLAAHGTRQDFEVETFIASVTGDRTHALTAASHSGATEDGTGRGVPVVAFHNRQDPDVSGEITHPLGAKDNGLAVAFSCKDYGADVSDIAQTLRAMGHAGSHANAGGQLAVAYNTEKEISHADAPQTDAGKILRELRRSIGEEAFAQWGLGVLASLRSPEVLRQDMLLGVAEEGEIGGGLDRSARNGEEEVSARAMRKMRNAGCARRSPHQWRPSGQQREQLDAHLSLLSQQGAPRAAVLQNLREAAQGIRVLRHALSEVQDDRRSSGDQNPAESEMHDLRQAGSSTKAMRAALHAGEAGRDTSLEIDLDRGETAHGEGGHGVYAVRRLTPRIRECLRLQGFPDDWFDGITYRGKPLADGPKYKMIGNSMAVPVMRYIGERISEIHERPEAA